MNCRRGTSCGGGASSLGYLFGSDATALARPNNRAPPRAPSQQPDAPDDTLMAMQQQQQQPHHYGGYNAPRSHQQAYNYAADAPSSGYETRTSGYHTPSAGASDYGSGGGGVPYTATQEANYRPSPVLHGGHQQTRAAGKMTNDGGGLSLDMSGGSMGRNNNYFRADGQNSGNFITARPSTRVQAAPGGGSSLGYLFGGA